MTGMILLCVALFGVGFLCGDAWRNKRWIAVEEDMKKDLLEFFEKMWEDKVTEVAEKYKLVPLKE